MPERWEYARRQREKDNWTMMSSRAQDLPTASSGLLDLLACKTRRHQSGSGERVANLLVKRD
jgi:hypothetical protein